MHWANFAANLGRSITSRSGQSALLMLALASVAVTVRLGYPLAEGALVLVCGAVLGAVLAHRQWSRAAGEILGRAPWAQGVHLKDRSDPTMPAQLLRITEHWQAMWHQQQALYMLQSEQLEALRRQAQLDATTKLPQRQHFLGALESLHATGGLVKGAGLVLVRVKDLADMNDRIGHASADLVLQSLGHALSTYPTHIERCQVGRLNGSDFALMLPVAGLAHETGVSLLQALQQSLARIDPKAGVVAGSLEWRWPTSVQQALAQADAALAQAEQDGQFVCVAVEQLDQQEATLARHGQMAWQRLIGDALGAGRLGLQESPVRTPDGRVLHLDCALTMQLEPDGPHEPASRWAALAARSRLSPSVETLALDLVLDAIVQDGQARCLSLSVQSLDSVEFVAAATRKLERSPAAAARLWIDIQESVALARPFLVRELAGRWRQLGVRLALAHAGDGLTRLPQLMDLGLECVRIERRLLEGIGADDADDDRRYLQGLVRLVQSVGLQISAEQVDECRDLSQLWQMGFDAAKGAAVSAPEMAEA